jgi:hypothetical protein
MTSLQLTKQDISMTQVQEDELLDEDEASGLPALLEQPGKVELKTLFVELRAKGWSYRRISKRLGVGKSTLANWSKELEAEIASLRAMELEGLQEQYCLLKEGRIRLLGGLLRKLRQEALSRDLSSLPTDKLLELLLKYQEALQAEYVEPRPISGREIQELKARSGTGLDSQAIARELDSLLQRYKAGLLDAEQARDELALLLAMLKAEEQAILEKKLEAIESVIKARRQTDGY